MVAANTQTMLGYINQRPMQNTFLTDMLVTQRRLHRTKTLVLDQVFGDREISPYVSRISKGHVVGRRGYDSLTHIAPYVKEKTSVTPEDTEVRIVGTTGYDQVQSADALLAADLDMLDLRIAGREEKQLAEAIQDGVITVAGEEESYSVDFQQLSTHKIELAGNDRWTVPSTAAALYTMIDANLRAWCQLPLIHGAAIPDVAICDVSASALIKQAFKSQLDNRRVDEGFIKPELLQGYNATYEGRIYGTGYNLHLYTYQGTYTIDGSAGTYMDAYTTVLANKQAPVTIEYGRINNLHAESVQYMARRFPTWWTEQDGSAKFLTVESSPMVNLAAPRQFVRAHVTNDA